MGAVLGENKERYGSMSASLHIVGILKNWNNGTVEY